MTEILIGTAADRELVKPFIRYLSRSAMHPAPVSSALTSPKVPAVIFRMMTVTAKLSPKAARQVSTSLQHSGEKVSERNSSILGIYTHVKCRIALIVFIFNIKIRLVMEAGSDQYLQASSADEK